MTSTSFPHQSAALIEKRAPGFKPKVGIILGSGLGPLADHIEDPITISYEELPGFPPSTVEGHAGKLILGKLNGTPVACLKGRAHSYEGTPYEAVKTYVRTMKLIGCEIYLATNAAGSLREEIGPGSLVVIKDHINFQPGNPLAGPNDDEFGPRFFPMDDAYDVELRKTIASCAETMDIPLTEGVYISVLGPSFETPMEIQAFKQWGAEVIGMSTVPEVLVARHCGLRVAVISTITNLACGLSKTPLSHDETLHYAGLIAEKLTELVTKVVESIDNDN